MGLLFSLFSSPLPSLTAAELSEKLNSAENAGRPLVLDVRQPEEYRQGHIAGSRLIPLGELGKRIGELPKDREIICVCASGSRSRSATRLLLDAGYNAVDMTGGIFRWQRSGLALKK